MVGGSPEAKFSGQEMSFSFVPDPRGQGNGWRGREVMKRAKGVEKVRWRKFRGFPDVLKGGRAVYATNLEGKFS
jgi:hypothetical protein